MHVLGLLVESVVASIAGLLTLLQGSRAAQLCRSPHAFPGGYAYHPGDMHIPQEAHCSCSRVDTSCAVTGYIVRRGALICTASGVQNLLVFLTMRLGTLVHDTTLMSKPHLQVCKQQQIASGNKTNVYGYNLVVLAFLVHWYTIHIYKFVNNNN